MFWDDNIHTSFGMLTFILIHLTQAGIKEMQKLWDKVVIDSRVSWEGDEYQYTDVCTPISSRDTGCRVSVLVLQWAKQYCLLFLLYCWRCCFPSSSKVGNPCS